MASLGGSMDKFGVFIAMTKSHWLLLSQSYATPPSQAPCSHRKKNLLDITAPIHRRPAPLYREDASWKKNIKKQLRQQRRERNIYRFCVIQTVIVIPANKHSQSGFKDRASPPAGCYTMKASIIYKHSAAMITFQAGNPLFIFSTAPQKRGGGSRGQGGVTALLVMQPGREVWELLLDDGHSAWLYRLDLQRSALTPKPTNSLPIASFYF